MGFGTEVKNFVEGLIDNANEVRTQVTHTPITLSDTDFNYGGVSESESSTATINAVPSQYVGTRLGLREFGHLEEGEVRILIKTAETVDINDKITFDSTDYFVRDIRPIHLNDVTVAKALILAKRQ